MYTPAFGVRSPPIDTQRRKRPRNVLFKMWDICITKPRFLTHRKVHYHRLLYQYTAQSYAEHRSGGCSYLPPAN